MPSNADLADALLTISKLIEILGQDSFRAIAHSKIARLVESSPVDFIELGRITPAAEAKRRLLEIEGVGAKIADKIVEFATTGRMSELDELRAAVPPGLLELLNIPGMGPKTINLVWKLAGVTDLAGLKRIIDSGEILSLPRMGAKSVEKLKGSIAIMAEANLRLALGPAQLLADALLATLRDKLGVPEDRIAFAGSLCRGKDTIGDLDILLAEDDPARSARAADIFTTLPGVRSITVKGETKCSVRMAVDLSSRWDAAEPADPSDPASDASPGGSGGATVQVDLRVVPSAAFGAALMYFTGSKEFNVKLRSRALDMGLTLNEYGLFPNDPADSTPPHHRGIKPVAATTERDIFTALKLAEVPPQQREDRGEVEAAAERFAAGHPGPVRLIELADVRAELHSHTTASDGTMSIIESAENARSRGFHTLAITDHSQSQNIANGLKPDRLLAHIKAIHAARASVPGITLLAGSEVDILSDGALDYTDEVLAKLDIVVGSPHAALSQEPEVATARLVRAIESGKVHILGHPTGRLVLRRKGLEPSMARIFDAARAHNVALEINAHWMRLDLRDTHVRQAIDAGCLIAINCDVHQPDDYDNLRFGVLTARRGWVTPDRCINCWDAARLHAWLKR
jgi:DNA polymerase (family X)